MTTIVQVASLAGVSTATVSRVLSHPDRVSPATHERVMAVVESLGYRPNLAARALRTAKAAKILVTVPDISNPFFASVIRGAEEAARDADYAVVLGDTRHDPALENQYADMLDRREVDGLVFLGHHLPDTLRAMVAQLGARAPIVNGCEYSSTLGVPSVHIDNAAAGRDATGHLIALGHQAIGLVTGPLASPISRARLAGALDMAEHHGLRDRIRVAHGDYSARSGHAQAAGLIAGGATALFCFSDEMAIGAISAVRDAGLDCPADVSVIGFDDLPLAGFFQPALTTIAQPKGAIGAQAVELLIRILDGAPETPPRVTLRHELVVRGSTRARG